MSVGGPNAVIEAILTKPPCDMTGRSGRAGGTCARGDWISATVGCGDGAPDVGVTSLMRVRARWLRRARRFGARAEVGWRAMPAGVTERTAEVRRS